MSVSSFNPEAFARWLENHFQKSSFKSYAEIGDKVGVSRTTISSLSKARPQSVSGKPSRPRHDLVVALANVLNADVDEALLLAGYAPTQPQANVQMLAARLAESVMAAGYDDLEDEELREDFYQDMETIAESMIKRQLEKQEKKRRKRKSE